MKREKKISEIFKMNTTSEPGFSQDEAKVLAACYRLLLEKAAERHARLARLAETNQEIQSGPTSNRGFKQDSDQ